MGERKVLNKHYPPDFDPSKVPRAKLSKTHQMKVRMMLPMRIKCDSCCLFIDRGTKFNMWKEDIVSEEYLGIQKLKFQFKCPNCASWISFKTDPKNNDYEVMSAASRNYESWREAEEVAEERKRKREAEEMGDVLKVLENKALDSKRKDDNMANVDELKCLRSRQAKVSTERVLGAMRREEEDKDRALAKSVFAQAKRMKVYSEELVTESTDSEKLVFKSSVRAAEKKSVSLKKKTLAKERRAAHTSFSQKDDEDEHI